MLKIDMHTHIIPSKLPRFADKFGYGGFVYLDHHKEGKARMLIDNKFFREIKSNCWNAGLRIEEYQEFHTQVQVICTIPVMFSYWAKPADTWVVAQFLNDHIAETVDQYPQHYIGLATLPMQDTELAIKELERCKQDLHLAGIQIGSNINQLNLNEPQFFPIFEACQDLGMAVLVHPWDMMGRKDMEKYWLPWLVGMPAETARAIASMIFGGVLEKLPKLRVAFAHAGGSFLATIGRIEHGFYCRPDLVAIDNPVNPRDYLGRFWVDSITHDVAMLKYVIGLIGSDKVMLGSDYPFPLGDLEIGKFIEESDIPSQDKEHIFYQSTLDWLQLDKNRFTSLDEKPIPKPNLD
ncbi:MAG: amidohydrolase family protein [Microscillaceae bacterium]|nr:amidohydrolase family protein [Microscillaceae bacterium]